MNIKRFKIISLLIVLLGIGASIYYKIHLLTVGLFLLLIYLLIIFAKWKGREKINNFNARSLMGIDVILFLMFILIFRLIQIQVFKYREYESKVDNQITRKYRESGLRGNIYDASGKRLAYNVNIYSLNVDPSRVIKNEDSLKALKELIQKKYIKGNYTKIENEIIKLGNEGKVYKLLEKNLDELEKKEVEEILKKYKISKGKEIFLISRNERKYYRKDLFTNLVGNIGFPIGDKGSEKQGIFGIEKEYEPYLRKSEIETKIPSIRSLGIKLPTSKAETKQDLDGRNLYLTIDNEIHYILNDAVKKQFENTRAEEAYGVIVDPNTGRVLGTSFFTKNKKDIRNPVFQDQMEPGSIFKPIVVSAALNEGFINRHSTFNIGDGKLRRYNHTIKESSRSVNGILAVEDILKRSSNVGMVMIGDKFTEKKFEEYLINFGFYGKTGVDFPFERKPYTVSSKKWDGLKKTTMSFGQGIVVTPIQIAMAFSAVINGGNLYRPYLVEKITDKNGTVIRRNLPTVTRKVISDKVSVTMRDILEKAVEEGTVKRAIVDGYRIGGKTGTAQVSQNGRYIKNEYLSSAIGFFPVENPKYVILVMFLKPQADILYAKFGGAVAAPVLGEVVSRLAKVKNILSKDISEIKFNKNLDKNIALPKIDMTVMPDLKDLSARDVLNIFKDYDYEIDMTGMGKVAEQLPMPGSDMTEITKIKVILK